MVQKQSRSVNTGVQIAIGLGALADINANNMGTLSDKQYLIWGDNGKALTFDQQIGDTKEYHSQRIWKVQNTKNVDKVQIAVPVSAIPAGKKLLVSNSDTDFTRTEEIKSSDTVIVSYEKSSENLKEKKWCSCSRL